MIDKIYVLDNEKLDSLDKVYMGNKPSRKIKFKNISFTKIGKFFDEQRIKRIEKKIEKKLNNMLDTQFDKYDLRERASGNSRAGNYAEVKSMAVAKLEAKVIFLETGEYPSAQEISNHAIKLKDQMMKNLQSKKFGYKALPTEIKEKIMENEVSYIEQKVFPEVEEKVEVKEEINENKPLTEDFVKKMIEEETNKLNKKIDKIQSEEINVEDVANAVEENLNQNNEVNIADLNVENVKEAVEEGFREEENDKNEFSEITYEDVKGIIENNLQDDEYTEEFEIPSPVQIVNLEPRVLPAVVLAKIKEPVDVEKKVEENEIVNINDDIFMDSKTVTPAIEEAKEVENTNREMPVVVVERDEEEITEKVTSETLENLYKELGETAINDLETSKEIRNKIAQAEEEYMEEDHQITIEEHMANLKAQEEKQETEEKEENIGFDISDASENDMNNMVEGIQSVDALESLKEKIKLLKQEEKRTIEIAEKATKEDEESKKELNETYKMLQEYAMNLEARCNENMAKVAASKEATKNRYSKINSIKEEIGISEENGKKM